MGGVSVRSVGEPIGMSLDAPFSSSSSSFHEPLPSSIKGIRAVKRNEEDEDEEEDGNERRFDDDIEKVIKLYRTIFTVNNNDSESSMTATDDDAFGKYGNPSVWKRRLEPPPRHSLTDALQVEMEKSNHVNDSGMMMMMTEPPSSWMDRGGLLLVAETIENDMIGFCFSHPKRLPLHLPEEDDGEEDEDANIRNRGGSYHWFWHIWLAGVAPHYRGRGVWKRLYEATELYCTQQQEQGQKKQERRSQCHHHPPTQGDDSNPLYLSIATYPSRFPRMYEFLRRNGFQRVTFHHSQTNEKNEREEAASVEAAAEAAADPNANGKVYLIKSI